MISPDVIKRALETIRLGGERYHYFFEHLSSPEWIEPLKEKGLFRHPPEKQEKHGYVTFRFWPESQYLARVASRSPEPVLRTILEIPETDNVRVHQDYAEAVCKMPAHLAARWAYHEAAWMAKQQFLYNPLPKALGKVIPHLAGGGETKAALDFAGCLLEILPGEARDTEEGEIYRPMSSPSARFDARRYREILDENVPGLVDAAGLEALNLLCALLGNVIRFSLRDAAESREDLSYFWRPAVEDHPKNHEMDLRDHLVVVVRDASERLIATKGAEVLEFLEKQKFWVFSRVGLHLRRLHFDMDIDGTASKLTNSEFCDNPHLHHECFLLLQEKFGQLTAKSQEAYLKLVEHGGDPSRWLDWREKAAGSKPDPEEGERYRRGWKFRKLWPVRNYLTGEHAQQFKTWKNEFGEPDYPEFAFCPAETRWVAPVSPVKSEDLAAMSLDELVSYLREWEPESEGIDSPSREGLAKVLKQRVIAAPSTLAQEANKFQGLDPTYVRAVLMGLHEVARNDATFSWEPVLKLCRWVVKQPRKIPGRTGGHFDQDADWAWTRKAIAELLSKGFESCPATIPHECRMMAWEVLKPLTDDPDPTPERESPDDGNESDPSNLSINSVRGESLHAVIRYALWVRRHQDSRENAQDLAGRGLDEMLEVREALNKHLDVDTEPSLAIRSVYGRWFPWLTLLDRQWAIKNRLRIFPTDRELVQHHDAAWASYITSCSPYNDVFSILKDEYRRAAASVGTKLNIRCDLANPDISLAEHLMTFCGRGLLEPGGDEILVTFFEKAPGDVRTHALVFVGQSLEESEDDVPEEVIQRFQKLWEWRLSQAIGGGQMESSKGEISSFGHWFTCGRFDNDWAIGQLQEALMRTGVAEPDFEVAKHLVEAVKSRPAVALNCLRLMAEGDKDGWRIYGWKDEARMILQRALGSDDEAVRDEAVALINYLGARRFYEFKELLPRSKSG